MFLLLIAFALAKASENTWQIPREYQHKLEQTNKNEFFSRAEWSKFSQVQQKAIQNILIVKHAEMRYAPLHTLQLKIFNSLVKNLNEAITYSLKTDCDSVSKQIPSNPLFYWMLETNGKFLTKPGEGKYRYSADHEGDYVYSISQEQKIVIPFIDANYEKKILNVQTLEMYEWENNILSISNSVEKINSFVPLKNVHSICPLECRIYDNLGYIPAFARSDSAGLLITLKNGLQMVWNRNEQQLYPVGFCRQFNINEDSYDYCKRLHTYLYTIRKPSQAFERVFFKKFIWQTPQKWYWDYQKSQLYGAFKKILIFGAACWAFWRINLFHAEWLERKILFESALKQFKAQVTAKDIPIPEILGL